MFVPENTLYLKKTGTDSFFIHLALCDSESDFASSCISYFLEVNLLEKGVETWVYGADKTPLSVLPYTSYMTLDMNRFTIYIL